MKEFTNIRIQKEIGKSSWFGFSLVLIDDLKDKRAFIIEKLLECNIEVRPIVAGNFVKNIAIKYMDYVVPYELVNANEIHDQGFFIGNHSVNNSKEVDYFIDCLKDSIQQI